MKQSIQQQKSALSYINLLGAPDKKQPKPITFNLDQPGRLRVIHVLHILNIARSTFYAGMKTGRYPMPSGYDGKMPYWDTSLIKTFLEVRAAYGANFYK